MHVFGKNLSQFVTIVQYEDMPRVTCNLYFKKLSFNLNIDIISFYSQKKHIDSFFTKFLPSVFKINAFFNKVKYESFLLLWCYNNQI